MLPGQKILQVRVTHTENDVFAEAAVKSGMSLSVWVRAKLRLAAMVEVDDAGPRLAGDRRGKTVGAPSPAPVAVAPGREIATPVPERFICGGCGCMVDNKRRCDICGRKDTIVSDPRGPKNVSRETSPPAGVTGPRAISGVGHGTGGVDSHLVARLGAHDTAGRLFVEPRNNLAQNPEAPSPDGAVGGPSDTGGEINNDPAAAEPAVGPYADQE